MDNKDFKVNKISNIESQMAFLQNDNLDKYIAKKREETEKENPFQLMLDEEIDKLRNVR